MRFAISALFAVLSLFFPGPLSGQPQKRPVPQESIVPITGFLTKGGVVNLIEGDVSGERAGIPVQPLKPKRQLEKGDVVRVGSTGRAEILLNPGYYLRLFKGAEATFMDLSPDSLKVKISNGTAIIEVLVIDLTPTFGPFPPDSSKGIYELVTLITPQGEFIITEGGVYRLDVKADGTCELKVTKGLADFAGNRVESGMKAAARNGTTTLMKLDRGFADDFDNWSRDRAALLVRANKSLKRTEWHKQMRRNRRSHFEINNDEWAKQARERFTVSATSGLVGFVEDGVVLRRGESEWEELSEGVSLQYGDAVRTGEASRAEILLYPTCQLHLSSATEIVYLEKSGGGVAVKVLKGSAIIVYKLDAKDRPLVTFVAPDGEYEIARRGVYRLNITQEGRSEMLVYRGRVKYAGGEIKEGKKVVSQDAGRAVLSIGKRTQDGFDLWSKQRGSWLISLFRINRTEYGGMWFFDQELGAHTFVPGVLDFQSPYGGKYSIRFRAREGGRRVAD